MFAFTKPPPYGLNMLYEFTRWPIMQKVHRHFAQFVKTQKVSKIVFSSKFFDKKKWSFDCL